jgi:hypothetical protein
MKALVFRDIGKIGFATAIPKFSTDDVLVKVSSVRICAQISNP